jgi:hypothetical protein
MTKLYLVLAGVLLVAVFAAARGPPGWEEAGFGKPALFQVQAEEYVLTLNLSGTASNSSTGEAFHVTLEAQGVLERTEPAAHGVQERGELGAFVRILDPATNTTIDAFGTEVSYHAQRASSLARGTDGWRFHLNSHGREGDLLHFGLHGNTTGLQVQDGLTQHVLVSSGGVSLKHADAHRASHFQLTLRGTGVEERA